MLSRSQAESGRTAKQEQERISPNHIQTIFHFSVITTYDGNGKQINNSRICRARARRERVVECVDMIVLTTMKSE